MKKILLGGVALGALVIATSVVTVPRAKAAPPLPMVPSWTGCYVGGNIGAGWGKNDIHHHGTVDTLSSNGSAPIFASTPFSNTIGIDTSGAVFGGQVGCDFQFAPGWLIGIQGMLAGTTLEGTANSSIFIPGADGFATSFNHRLQTTAIGSVTGRLGFTGLFNPQTLVYVKGGWAWSRNRLETIANDVNLGIPTSIKYTLSGPTVGGGIEWMFVPGWSVFAEYNHYWFDNKNIFSGSFDTVVCCPTFVHVDQTIDANNSRIDTVTLGVNFRWGAGPPRP